MERRQSTADQNADGTIAGRRDLGQRPEVRIDKRAETRRRRAEQGFLIAQHHRKRDNLLLRAVEHPLLIDLGLIVALEKCAVAGCERTLRVHKNLRRVASDEQPMARRRAAIEIVEQADRERMRPSGNCCRSYRALSCAVRSRMSCGSDDSPRLRFVRARCSRVRPTTTTDEAATNTSTAAAVSASDRNGSDGTRRARPANHAATRAAGTIASGRRTASGSRRKFMLARKANTTSGAPINASSIRPRRTSIATSAAAMSGSA